MKKPIPFHPLLFAAFPVTFAYAANVAYASLSEVVLPAAAVLGLTIIFWSLLWLVYRDRYNTAIALSFFLILFFSFGHILEAVRQLAWIRVRTLFSVWILLMIFGALLIKRRSRPLLALTRILNVMGIFLVGLSLLNITVYELRNRGAVRNTDDHISAESDAALAAEAGRLPDIYYIVLDRYSRADVLDEVYGCDNSSFLEYLTKKGFYVASDSRSNYLKTTHSLASSLNMEHLLHLTCLVGEDSDNRGSLYRMIQDHKVGRILKSKGYKFMHFGSWWQPTAYCKLADHNINLSVLPEFFSILYRTTLLSPVLSSLNIYDTRRMQWKRVLYKFDRLAEMPAIDGPTFIFAHMLIPHPPYVFDRDGNFVPSTEADRKPKELKYREQLAFTNKKLMQLVDRIISESPVPPIIILQADEGEYPRRYQADIKSFNWRHATPIELREKMGILNAYYLPGFPKEKLYPTVTPVNTFRFIFNHYLGMNFDLLPDNCYAFEDEHHIYKFFDATEKLESK